MVYFLVHMNKLERVEERSLPMVKPPQREASLDETCVQRWLFTLYTLPNRMAGVRTRRHFHAAWYSNTH